MEKLSLNFSPGDCQKFLFTALQKYQPPDWQDINLGTASLLKAFTQPSFISQHRCGKRRSSCYPCRQTGARKSKGLAQGHAVKTAANLALEIRPPVKSGSAGLDRLAQKGYRLVPMLT